MECQLIEAPRPSPLNGLEIYEGAGEEGGLGPAELRSAYNLPNTGGAEETIAVVDSENDPNANADLAAYRHHYELSECTEESGCLTKIDARGETEREAKEHHAYFPRDGSEGSGAETSLDLDMVSAACEDCHILLVESASEEASSFIAAQAEALAYRNPISGAKASAVSDSWNFGFEQNNPANANVPSDCGCWVTAEEEASYDRAFDHPETPILVAGGDYGYAVRYPADSPYVIAVGGTALIHVSEAGTGRAWTEEVWGNPADGADVKGRGTGSGCSLYESQPSWQSGVDVACKARMSNDVAADADPNVSPVSVYDTYDLPKGETPWQDFGGTSASTPFIAGVEGLSTAYARSLGADAFYADRHALHDVTKGSDGTCPEGEAYFCKAEVGYDGPTGNGTPDGPLDPKLVANVQPNAGPAVGGTTVRITGSDFIGATAVDFGATPAKSFTVDSTGLITAIAPPGTGTVDVLKATW